MILISSVSDLITQKTSLRLDIKEKLKNLSPIIFDEAGKKIAFCHIEPWLCAQNLSKEKNIAFFANFTSEINTCYLGDILKKHRFNSFLPKILTDQEIIFTDLTNNKKIADLKDFYIIFIPGLLFDISGNRLGRGKGHYDRFLQDMKSFSPRPLLVGLSLDEQIVANVPVDKYDVPMDFICTPKLGMLDVRKNKK